jgi:hypothetical protein
LAAPLCVFSFGIIAPFQISNLQICNVKFQITNFKSSGQLGLQISSADSLPKSLGPPELPVLLQAPLAQAPPVEALLMQALLGQV